MLLIDHSFQHFVVTQFFVFSQLHGVSKNILVGHYSLPKVRKMFAVVARPKELAVSLFRSWKHCAWKWLHIKCHKKSIFLLEKVLYKHSGASEPYNHTWRTWYDCGFIRSEGPAWRRAAPSGRARFEGLMNPQSCQVLKVWFEFIRTACKWTSKFDLLALPQHQHMSFPKDHSKFDLLNSAWALGINSWFGPSRHELYNHYLKDSAWTRNHRARRPDGSASVPSLEGMIRVLTDPKFFLSSATKVKGETQKKEQILLTRTAAKRKKKRDRCKPMKSGVEQKCESPGKATDDDGV